MTATSLPEWNRTLVSQTLELLEQSERTTHEAASRLRDFLNVNPGGPSIPFSPESGGSDEIKKAAPVHGEPEAA